MFDIISRHISFLFLNEGILFWKYMVNFRKPGIQMMAIFFGNEYREWINHKTSFFCHTVPLKLLIFIRLRPLNKLLEKVHHLNSADPLIDSTDSQGLVISSIYTFLSFRLSNLYPSIYHLSIITYLSLTPKTARK